MSVTLHVTTLLKAGLDLGVSKIGSVIDRSPTAASASVQQQQITPRVRLRVKSTHPGQPRSAGSGLNFPENHVSLNHKRTPCRIGVSNSSSVFMLGNF